MKAEHSYTDALAQLPADPNQPLGLPSAMADLLTVQTRAARSPDLTRLPGVWVTYRLLALQALSGWSLRWSLVEAEARVRGIYPKSGTIKRSIAQLEQAGLWETSVVHTVGAYAFVRLTERGQEVIRSVGIDAIEGEWERLERKHRGGAADQVKHTAAVCTFAHHARIRGYGTKVAPVVDDPTAEPDVVLDSRDETLYVEVQRRGGDAWKRAAKWWNLMRLQGKVALCAITPLAANRFQHELQRCGIERYCITDLQTLHRQAPERLWTAEQNEQGIEERT